MSLKLEDLWIGDRLRILTSGRVGTFEGIADDGRARIRSEGKIYRAPDINLELAPETTSRPAEPVIPEEKKYSIADTLAFDSTIDLHIEVLKPELTHEAPQLILQHQIKKCKEHISEAIKVKAKIITIIHGHGSGQLRREVEHILSLTEQVRYHIPTMSGAATEVWMK